MNYLLEVCGDCNDANYAYSISVISEESLLRVKEMLKSITKVRTVYKKYHPEIYVSCGDNLPYYSKVLESLPNPDMEYDEEDIEKDEEWLKEVDKSDISNFLEFQDTYIPYGTSDLDYVHTIESIKAYKLAEDNPINLL